MINYIGIPCPICKHPFKEEDDIVVCPECGAPYHRECYKKTGHCVFSDKHGNEDMVFPFEDSKNLNQTDDFIICHNCSTKNSKSEHICKKCGITLTENIPNPSRTTKMYNNPLPIITFDPMGHVNEDENFSGVNAKELASYIKVNTAYYMPAFKLIKDTKATKFNFSAFLFSGGWFLYRKQYKLGTIITIIMFTLIIGSTCIEMLHNTPLIKILLSNSGISLNSSSIITSQNMQALMQQIIPLSLMDKLLLFAPTAISILEFIIMIICGFIGNKEYMKHCIKTVTKLKNGLESNTPINNYLAQKGGINKAIALSLLACYFIIIYFLKFALL